MTLRHKTLLTIGVPIIVAMVVLYFILSNVWFSRLWRVEMREGTHNAALVARMLTSRIDRYETFTQDWAAWDDAYQFVQDLNADFIDSNLGDDTLNGLGLSYMLYLNPEGKLLMGRGHEVKANRPRPVSPALLALLKPGNALLRHETIHSQVSGLVMLPDGPLLIVTQPIVTSDRTGPPRGILVFARYLDDEISAELSQTAGLHVKLHGLTDDPDLGPSEREALASLRAGAEVVTLPADARSLVGYTIVRDIYGRPAQLLQVTGARVAPQLARDAIQSIMLALLTAGAICVLSVLYFTQRHVLSRMEQVSREIGEVAATGDLSQRLSTPGGRDELSLLAERINNMLQALEQAENERLEDRKRYEAVVEQIAEGVAVIDVGTGRCLEANAAMHAMLGYEPGELPGLPEPRFYLRAGLTRQKIIKRCREQSNPPAVETQFHRKDGTSLEVEAGYAVATAGGEEVLGIVARDITVRKLAQAEQLALEDNLQRSQRLQAVGQLAAGLAHNFNNILAAILGTVDLCLRDADPVFKERLHTIEKSTQRAAELVKQFIAFARHAKPTRAPLDLRATVDEVVTVCRQTFDRRLTIAVADMTDLPPVYADRGQIHQLLLNLCLNARDALIEDGEVRPEARLEISAGAVFLPSAEARRIERNPGPYVRLVIADNGMGMSPQIRERIFEPFFTTKEIGVGTGLGLASVYGIVLAHEGYIACHSEPERGTAFEMYLPVSITPLVPEEETAPAHLRGSGETILLVDDEPEIRKLSREVLTRYGYEVLLADDGKDGLDVFTQYCQEIDLVLLDLTMPRMSGQELMREMLQRAPDTRIVIITGHAELSVSLEEAQALLPKPFGIQALLQTVRSVLDA